MAFECLEDKDVEGVFVKLIEFGEQLVGKVKFFDQVTRKLAIVRNDEDKLTLITEKDVTSCKIIDTSEVKMTEEQLKDIFGKVNIKSDPLSRPVRRQDLSHLKSHHYIKMETLLTGVPPPIPEEPLPQYTDSDGHEYYQLPAVEQTTEHRLNSEGGEVHGGLTEKVIRDKLWDNHRHYPLLVTPTKMYFIDKVDSLFRWALFMLQNRPTIGVSCQGRKISRNGVLSLIIFSTEDIVFMFDITRLNDNAFNAGLKVILESPYIKKVVHDVRPVVDILHYQYGVTLENISDTMVNDLVFCQEHVHDGFVPATFRSLAACLKDYLGIADFHIFYPRERVTHIWSDAEPWMERPLSPYMMLAAARTCLYLLRLNKIIRRGLYLNFHHASSKVARSLRGLDQVDKEAVYDDPHYFCPAVARLRHGPSYNLDPARKPLHKVHDKSIHPNVASPDPLCIYSKDSMHMTY